MNKKKSEAVKLKTDYTKLVGSIAVIAILLIIVCSVFPYNYFLGGKPSSESLDWGAFGDYFGGVPGTFFSLLAFGVSLFVLYKSTQSVKEQNTYKIMENYRSEKMGIAVSILFNFHDTVYRDYNKKGERPAFPEYFKAEYEKKYNEYQSSLTNKERKDVQIMLVETARRYVSYFYLHAAILLQHNKVDKQAMKYLFGGAIKKGNFNIIDDIIIPCERKLSDIIGKKNKEYNQYKIKNEESRKDPNKIEYFEFLQTELNK